MNIKVRFNEYFDLVIDWVNTSDKNVIIPELKDLAIKGFIRRWLWYVFKEEVKVEDNFVERSTKGVEEEEGCESEFKEVEKIGEREWKGIWESLSVFF